MTPMTMTPMTMMPRRLSTERGRLAPGLAAQEGLRAAAVHGGVMQTRMMMRTVTRTVATLRRTVEALRRTVKALRRTVGTLSAKALATLRRTVETLRRTVETLRAKALATLRRTVRRRCRNHPCRAAITGPSPRDKSSKGRRRCYVSD